MSPEVHLINVFPASRNGGNLAPTVARADGMSDLDMQTVATTYGHECGFVCSPPADSDYDYALRFWVPNHEMEMCGHATVGAVWLLKHLGLLQKDLLNLWTLSGRVQAQVSHDPDGAIKVEITQPKGHVEVLTSPDIEAEIVSVLGISTNELAPLPIQNASTSRVKTLIPLKSVAVLDGLKPDYRRIEQLCERIGSTGLYPYAIKDLAARQFDARQFPKSSGYPEDAATGIAAAALAFGLLENGLVSSDERPLYVRQGRAMGRPSEISLRFRRDDHTEIQGLWLGGAVSLAEVHA
ncbi:PhzF family phenazine biosynthesis protein [Pseudomonas sp. HN2-3]|jgi:PhzF family phenazine biosynthesis protein|uniref:PhzF family phenazine biosynthesis protein n=1 Tax=Pseudomonas sp. HN2-3 TaxID=2886360 RepID=UPI001D12B1B2|nr:PhzF family phenazine biosynthesis isomerase [Pseudomonas sp. HN2-3]UDU81216.1 PhzF family phenazine biosynthesis isomerase [Pseudomonas sp. HN2-3]